MYEPVTLALNIWRILAVVLLPCAMVGATTRLPRASANTAGRTIRFMSLVTRLNSPLALAGRCVQSACASSTLYCVKIVDFATAPQGQLGQEVVSMGCWVHIPL